MSNHRSSFPHHVFKRPTEFQRLYEIAAHIPTFLSTHGQSFAAFPFNSGKRIFPLRSPMVRDWLVHTWLEESPRAPKEANVRAAIRTLEASIQAKPKTRGIVYHRIAGYGEPIGPVVPNPTRIVIDLANTAGEVLAIDSQDWDVTPGESHCFTRGRHMRELPRPVRPESAESVLSTFRRLLNPATTKDFHRILIWLLSAFRGSGPMPVLSLEGPPSSGKTTAAHLLARLVDPCAAPFADPAASHRELTGHINRNWLIAFDNVERLLPRLTTFINSLAAGTSQHVRQPHDPHDPVSTHFQRPVLLTGSGVASAAPSLQTRTLRAALAPLTPERNRPLTEIFSEFEELLPQLLALICTALSAGLRNLKHVKPARLPRLADAMVWAMAAAPALGLTEEEILAAIELDPDPDDPFVGSVKSLMAEHPTWTGTATNLAEALSSSLSPKGVSQQLRRQLDALAAAGITVAFPRTGAVRTIILKSGADPLVRSPAPRSGQAPSDASSLTVASQSLSQPVTQAPSTTSTPSPNREKSAAMRHRPQANHSCRRAPRQIPLPERGISPRVPGFSVTSASISRDTPLALPGLLVIRLYNSFQGRLGGGAYSTTVFPRSACGDLVLVAAALDLRRLGAPNSGERHEVRGAECD